MFSTICLICICGATQLAPAEKKAPPVAELRPHNGAPTIFINGRPHPGTSYMTYSPEAENFKSFGDAGVHLYTFSATPTQTPYKHSPLAWTSTDEFDFSHMDARAHMVLTADAKAYFFPRIFLGTPDWWAEKHPGELVLYDPGKGAPEVYMEWDSPMASWASERWREDTVKAILRFIEHVENSEYADRVIGYHLASGTTEEWMQWGSNTDRWTDYSAPNVARFRDWLKKRYETDRALREAWNDENVRLVTAEIPKRIDRQQSELGYLRDPAVAQPSIDYGIYTSELVAETIAYFAKEVKGATRRQRLVGAFYGYVLQLAGEQREINSGHLALREMFSCPDVDFFTSPSSYAFRDLGVGFPHAMSLPDSLKLHGKVWFDENDFRTWLTQGIPVGRFGKTGTYEETLQAQRREFAWILTNRMGMWWFDMGGGWYQDPRMMDNIGRMEAIAQENIDADVSSVAEVVFVVDGKSSTRMRPDNAISDLLLVAQLPELGRIGAPFATIHLADLDRAPEYKLYIFPNCMAPSDAERLLIEQKVHARNAAVLWVGPAGLYKNGKLEPKSMKALTGYSLRLDKETETWQVNPTVAAEKWGWTDAAPFGAERDAGVVSYADAPDGIVLGKITGTELAGLVVNEEGQIRAFASVAPVPTAFLRKLAEKAGVHMYSETQDIVWASRDLLAVSVREGGTRTISLPRRCKVVDLWTGKTVAEDADQFDTEIAENATALFRLY